jgi:hypothetical protein
MPADDITRQLAAMLGQDVADAESTGDPTRQTAPNVYHVSSASITPTRQHAVSNRGTHVQTGRSGTGRLRNFRAMNDIKLCGVWDAVCDEDNDPEAYDAVLEQMLARGLVNP